jgi:hypothetical protein
MRDHPIDKRLLGHEKKGASARSSPRLRYLTSASFIHAGDWEPQIHFNYAVPGKMYIVSGAN